MIEQQHGEKKSERKPPKGAPTSSQGKKAGYTRYRAENRKERNNRLRAERLTRACARFERYMVALLVALLDVFGVFPFNGKFEKERS